MGFKILFVLALSVYLASGASTREETHDSAPNMDEKNDEGSPIPGYDCSGKRIGNHNHPTECTKFISCNHAGLAYEMNCALCTPGDSRCPEGRTNYNYAADACLWPHEAGCAAEPPPTPTDEPATTTTTRRTTTPEPTCWDDRPEMGSPCDPDDCELDGCCHEYWWCEREKSSHKGKGKAGTWVNGSCTEEHNLYFNPDKTEHGGFCDFWTGLTEEMQGAYNRDKRCIDPHCEWDVDREDDGKVKWCVRTYRYFHPDRYEGERVTLECPDQLLWSEAKNNCLHCSEVFGEDGQPCCPHAEE